MVAEIMAPAEMLNRCVVEQGKIALFEKTFGVNEELQSWLKENVVEGDDSALVLSLVEKPLEIIEEGPGLPFVDEPLPELSTVSLSIMSR